MSYASKTKVPVSRSMEQIRTMLMGYGADAFITGERTDGTRVVEFEHSTKNKPGDDRVTLHLRFTMKLPRECSAQEERRMWRALYLVIKAKLEAVQSKISSFQEEFLPWVVMPNGRTFADHIVPQLEKMAASGGMPLLEAK